MQSLHNDSEHPSQIRSISVSRKEQAHALQLSAQEEAGANLVVWTEIEPSPQLTNKQPCAQRTRILQKSSLVLMAHLLNRNLCAIGGMPTNAIVTR